MAYCTKAKLTLTQFDLRNDALSYCFQANKTTKCKMCEFFVRYTEEEKKAFSEIRQDEEKAHSEKHMCTICLVGYEQKDLSLLDGMIVCDECYAEV